MTEPAVFLLSIEAYREQNEGSSRLKIVIPVWLC
jgi:hypothetical protein